MAIIKFINNKVSLYKTINYVCKEEKSQSKLIDGKDCIPENAYEEMIMTKKQYNKLGGRDKIHFVQSFSPEDDITTKEAYEIGMILAEEFKDFQVLVATHEDKKHIHNHFVINTVNINNGLKIQFSKKDLEKIKELSNKLCIERNLKIINNKSRVDDIKNKEYKARNKGISWKEKLEKDILKVMNSTNTKYQFFNKMNKLGYKVTWKKDRKNITYTTPDGYKCRDRKLHKEIFLKENMEQVYREQQQNLKLNKNIEKRRYSSVNMLTNFSFLVQQFKHRENEEILEKSQELNTNAKKQLAMEMHYSLEELEDMEM